MYVLKMKTLNILKIILLSGLFFTPLSAEIKFKINLKNNQVTHLENQQLGTLDTQITWGGIGTTHYTFRPTTDERFMVPYTAEHQAGNIRLINIEATTYNLIQVENRIFPQIALGTYQYDVQTGGDRIATFQVFNQNEWLITNQQGRPIGRIIPQQTRDFFGMTTEGWEIHLEEGTLPPEIVTAFLQFGTPRDFNNMPSQDKQPFLFQGFK